MDSKDEEELARLERMAGFPNLMSPSVRERIGVLRKKQLCSSPESISAAQNVPLSARLGAASPAQVYTVAHDNVLQKLTQLEETVAIMTAEVQSLKTEKHRLNSELSQEKTARTRIMFEKEEDETTHSHSAPA